MYSRSEPSCEEIIQIVDKALFENNQELLKDLETEVFRGSIKGKTYDTMGDEIGLTGAHVCETGSILWKRLSKAIGEEVSKSNFLQPIKRYRDRQAADGNAIHTTPLNASQTKVTPTPRESPEGLVPLDSRFYIERCNVESLCNLIKQPGALLRLKAPQKMGKTSELERVIAKVKNQGYEVVKLNCEVDRTVLSNPHRFFQHFCACVSKDLGIDIQLDKYWEARLDCIANTTNYFEEYLLPKCSNPLVLVLDNVDRVFEQPEAKEFCFLLRYWHNTLAKQSDERGEIWKKIRLIIIHSTDVYASLEIVNSPLNGVGEVVALEEFNREQVIELTRRYGFNFTEDKINQLRYWFGGHPYLLRLALDHLKYEQVSLERLLQIAPTPKSPFRAYLQHHLGMLTKQKELATAFQKVIEANKPVSIKDIVVAFKLESMGLVKMEDDDYWIPSCNLFYQYFLTHFKNFLSD